MQDPLLNKISKINTDTVLQSCICFLAVESSDVYRNILLSLWEAAKKLFFLVARPLRGGRGYGPGP